MKRFTGLAAVIVAVVALSACGKTEAPPAAPTAAPAPTAPAPAPAPVPQQATMPAPQHGGQMVMSGNFHAEIEASAEEVEAYFYDAQGKPITGASAANVLVQISMSDGHRAKAEMKAHETHYTTGEVLEKMGVHAPFDGAISATINGQPAQFRFTAAGGGAHHEGGDNH